MTAPRLPAAEIDIAAIDVVDRLRRVDPAYVEMIAASAGEVGLQQPIAVAPGPGNRFVLVDGEHRLEAARRLGWAAIPAIVRDLTPQEREKHEIHANLIRANLNALDQAVFVARLAEIFEAEQAETKNGGDRKSRKWLEKNRFRGLASWSAFAKEASRRTGLGQRSLYMCRQLIGDLADEARALLHGTPLAGNAAQLRALAELDADHQVALARAVKDGARSLNAAKVAIGLMPKGGAVREQDRPLARLEVAVLRLTRAQLVDLKRIIETRIATIDATAKPKKAAAPKPEAA